MLRPTPMRVLITVMVLGLTLSGLAVSPVFSDDPLQRIETDDPLVQVDGNWTSQTAAGASGGSYSFSSGSPDDVLTLAFDGSALTVIYVTGPQLGILAVEVDGTVLRTIITTSDTVQYSQTAEFDYLAGGSHVLRLYASGGMVAVDAILATPAPSPDATAVVTTAGEDGPAVRGYDTLAALGELDSTIGPAMTLYRSFADTSASGDYWRQGVNYLANVMGDWNGDGYDTFGTVYAGRFDYTDVTPDLFVNAEKQSARVELGVEGVPVVGRFSPAFPRDCIGVVSAFPENPTLYVLSYVCDYASPVVRQQYLGAPLPDQDGYSGPTLFGAGDFDGDGFDSIAVMRGAMIAYTNVDPSEGDAVFTQYQYWGEPFSEGGPATLVVGDWDGDGVDSFGVVYGSDDTSYFYRRNDLGSDESSFAVQVVTATSRVAVWR